MENMGDCERTQPERTVSGRSAPQLTRTRFIELTQQARLVCEMLERAGVTKEEGCFVKGSAEELWNLKP